MLLLGGQCRLSLHPVLEITNSQDSQETVSDRETIISHMWMSQYLHRQRNGEVEGSQSQTSNIHVVSDLSVICLFT